MEEKTNLMISTEDLSFSFKNEAVIKNINLRVEKGAIYGFLGPNGAGKTTTIRLLSGLLKSEPSSIRLFGKQLTKYREDIFSKTGSLIEQPSLYDHLSGYDNLLITAKYRNIPQERITAVLEQVKLSDAASKKVTAYSLGMKQRLGLALALLGKPELLILDEPVNGLDPMGIIEIRALLLQLNRDYGITIFLSSHLLSEIEKLVTHIGIINKGSLIFQGTLDQLNQLHQKESVIRIHTDNDIRAKDLLTKNHLVSRVLNGLLEVPSGDAEQAASIIKLLIQENFRVYHLELWAKDLEKTFIDLTEN